MKISYKRNWILYWVLGLVWLIITSVILFFTFEKNVYNIIFQSLWIAITLFVIGYSYSLFIGYLTIKNGIIKENIWFGKKLKLSEIKQIKKFAGDYILKIDDKEMIINTQIIDPKSLEELNSELEKLSVDFN